MKLIILLICAWNWPAATGLAVGVYFALIAIVAVCAGAWNLIGGGK